MTELLERAVETARGLPPARLVLQLAADEEPPVVLTGDERAAIARSKAAAARGEFATDEQVRRSGQSTVCEGSLYPSGARRSRRDS